MIHFEFLNCNQTLNPDLYSQQLQRENENLPRKRFTLIDRRNVVLLYDNTRPHSARITQEKILDYSLSILHHPSYLLDLASNDFHLFLLDKILRTINRFSQENQVKMFVENAISKLIEFYLPGISNLPDKWFEVIENNDEYTIDWKIHRSLTHKSILFY